MRRHISTRQYDIQTAYTLTKVTEEVYFDIKIDGVDTGRIVFRMFGDTAPKTVKNFSSLAKGDSGTGNSGK